MVKWIKNNKYWSSVIVLFILGIPISMLTGIEGGFGAFMGNYVAVGSIIWAFQTKKKGLLLIVLGSQASLGVLLGVFSLTVGSENLVANVVITVLASVVAFICLFFGIRRYKGRGNSSTKSDLVQSQTLPETYANPHKDIK